MINKFTHTENRQMVEILTLQAIELGLMDADLRLVYQKGNTTQGHSTEIYVEKINEDGHRTRQPRPQWLPEFGYKDGPAFVGNVIYAVQNALYGMIGVKQAAERAKRQELSAHVARRSGTEEVRYVHNSQGEVKAVPDNRTNDYRRYELDKVDASGEYPAKVKFFSDSGDSKHLNITATEFEQIKHVLLDYRND